MANKQTGGTRLTGINPLAYMGTEPASPPQLVRYQQQPTNRDFGFNLGTIWIVDEPFQMYMLSEKPQNVAVWRLIYPQGNAGGISLITTDNGDVAADVNGEIQMNGGENINIAAGTPDQVVVNLNRTIRWPATNMAATEGVIFLDGDRFIHNYGPNGNTDTNTFIGVNSGNFTLMGIGNTACGNQSLESLTSGRENSAVGSLSLSNLTTGISNCALGVGAGGNLTNGDSLNICINNFGTAGDTGITRIGTEGDQTEAHISGIFGATVAGTVTDKKVLNIDDTGQLGEVEFTSLDGSIDITQTDNGHLDFSVVETGSGGALTPTNFGTNFSVPFLGIQQAVANNVTGDGTVYRLGAAAPMVEQYDYGNNFNPGNGVGVPASFVAPAQGVYSFTISVLNKQSATIFIGITSPVLNYLAVSTPSTPQFSCSVKLNAGNTVNFVAISTTSGSLNVNIIPILDSVLPNTINACFVSGYRIA
jgi:hypothetical protein